MTFRGWYGCSQKSGRANPCPAGVAFLKFINCLGCCTLKMWGSALPDFILVGIGLTDCTPDVSLIPPKFKNPASAPGFGKWYDDVIYDTVFKEYGKKGSIEGKIKDVLGKAPSDFFDTFDDWYGKCKKPICFVECAIQFYVDLEKARLGLDPWQLCCLRQTRSDCEQCCDELQSNGAEFTGVRWKDCWLACGAADYEDE